MLKSLMLPLVFGLLAMFAVATPSQAATIKAHAEVVGQPGLKFKADYREKVKQGQTKGQKLRVQVKHAFPLQTLEVAVNGELIGTITTNLAGRGKLNLSSSKNTVPLIHSGDVITVGTATATFFTKADKYHVHGHIQSDISTVTGLVKYFQKPHKGILDQRFMVNIEGAFAGEVLDVMVNDTFVGSITADDLGAGQLKLRTAQFAGDSWQPLPDGFASLHAGDTVTVGLFVVTLH